jgi:endogenous inhibitor of DNA gyrase (YacG/DUF329 family)
MTDIPIKIYPVYLVPLNEDPNVGCESCGKVWYTSRWNDPNWNINTEKCPHCGSTVNWIESL